MALEIEVLSAICKLNSTKINVKYLTYVFYILFWTGRC